MELTVHASSMSFFSCSWSAEQNPVFLSVKLRPSYDPFVSRFRQETAPSASTEPICINSLGSSFWCRQMCQGSGKGQNAPGVF